MIRELSRVLIVLLFLCFAEVVSGEPKVFSNHDLERYSNPADRKQTELPEDYTSDNSGRVGYFDLTDIELEIKKIDEEIMNIKKEGNADIDKCFALSAARSNSFGYVDVGMSPLERETLRLNCASTVHNNYEQLIRKKERQKDELQQRHKELSQEYQKQEAREELKRR